MVDRLSVVIPVYNAAKYLRACLDSVLAQTMRDFEVVCVDDGSTDGSLAILNEYAKRDARIKVISCEHTNAGHCRNIGIAESHGEYLLFLDADDVFAPEMFETLLNAATETKADVAICGHRRFFDGDDVSRCFSRADEGAYRAYRAKDIDIFRWIGSPWDKVIARRIVDRYSLRFQEQRSTNDVCFIFSALSVAETIVECPAVFVAYRVHADSLTATRDKSPQCFYAALVGYYDKMCELGIFPHNGRLLKDFCVYSCDQSFYQFDTVSGSEAAYVMFPLLKELCVRWNWCEVLESDDRHPLLRQRCKSLAEADNVVEAYKSDLAFLRECFDELEAVKQSHTYRLAQLLVKWIRRFRG